MQLKPQIIQDGAEFYHEPTGRVIASYKHLVKNDYDTAGAQAARREFAHEFPEFVLPARTHKAKPGECTYCDREREAKSDFHPSHDASPYCESGKHNHCTCDTCF